MWSWLRQAARAAGLLCFSKGAGASPKTRKPFSGLVWFSKVGLVLVWFLIDLTPAWAYQNLQGLRVEAAA
ncbi:hypothetical protein VM1G_11373 [Cytospora mali]|uniref:Uncharacterized protein n=1 Tax=Cytospora mali TaxID=578113 RepID=A0A194VP77_CYTMA|nr:hypothetical protein VM1G_11373 [Valsa mali]